MPYICTQDNRYIGEHSCNKYHYGNMDIFRECCVNDCIKYALLADKNAITIYHPAVLMFESSWNSLTNKEMDYVSEELKKQGIITICGYLINPKEN
jgi:hypothetical protein